MAKGKHYGAFAKGFTDSLVAMMKLSMTRDLYAARARYFDRKGYPPPGKGINDPGVQDAINKGKAEVMAKAAVKAAARRLVRISQPTKLKRITLHAARD